MMKAALFLFWAVCANAHPPEDWIKKTYSDIGVELFFPPGIQDHSRAYAVRLEEAKSPELRHDMPRFSIDIDSNDHGFTDPMNWLLLDGGRNFDPPIPAEEARARKMMKAILIAEEYWDARKKPENYSEKQIKKLEKKYLKIEPLIKEAEKRAQYEEANVWTGYKKLKTKHLNGFFLFRKSFNPAPNREIFKEVPWHAYWIVSRDNKMYLFEYDYVKTEKAKEYWNTYLKILETIRFIPIEKK